MSSSVKLYKALTLFYEEYIQPFDANSCLVIIAILTVIYFAWISTEVPEIHRTVYIFDSHRFRRHNSLLVSVFSTTSQSRQQQTPQSVGDTAESEAHQGQTQESASVEIVAQQEPAPPTVEEAIDEVYTLTGQQRALEQMTIDSLQENIESVISETFQGDPGPQQIIREMDRDDMELRYRPSTSAQARSLEADNSASSENCSNENSENEKISKTRSTTDAVNASNHDSEFTVKLKYLNDDVKIVKAKPNEPLKEFKSRNFSVELEAQKIVRLVFNGQVLSPDNKTLQSCGLFDNCVVHCLVHNRKVQSGGDSSPNSTGEGTSSSQGISGPSNTNSNGNGFFDLLSHRRFNTVFNCLSCLTVMFCWFCRFEYSYLFNIYSTIGLILITVMLIFMLPIVYLMDWD